MSTTSSKNRIPRPAPWRRALPVLALAAGLAVSYTAWREINVRVRHSAQATYAERTAEVTVHLREKLREHEVLLRGAAGLFQVQGEVTRTHWRRYAGALQAARMPGASTLQYIESPGEGRQGASSIGSDGDPDCREAMERARDQGRPAISARLRPTPGDGSEGDGAILMYVPLYRPGMPAASVQERRAALRGFVYSQIHLRKIAGGIASALASGIGFSIRDGRTAARLATSGVPLAPGYRPVFASARAIEVYGRPWTLEFATLPSFQERLAPAATWTLLGGGAAVSILLFLMTWILTSTRARALALANHMAQELRESERRFGILANSAPVLIWIAGMERLCIWFNQGWLNFTGRSMEQEVGNGWLEGVHPEDLARVMDTYRQAFAERRPFTQEYRLRRADGTYRWLLDGGVPRVDDQDCFAGFIGSCIDITERKQLENDLKLASVTLNNIDDAVYWMTPDARIWNANAAACRMLGYTREEMLALSVPDIDPRVSMEVWKGIWQQLTETGGVSLRSAHRTKDGREIPIEITSTYIRFRDQEFSCSIIRDITERQRYEQELVRARETADSANRAKSDFVANMSHEIRTPLNGVIGMNALLLNTRLDHRQRRYAELVRDSAGALHTVLDEILDFSKIEAGMLELESADFNLRALVEGVAELMAIKAQHKGLELLCRIDANVPTELRGDPGRLRQVLTNLVVNAVKFTAEGEVSLRVRLQSDGPTVVLRFEVVDTGIGVPKAKRALLFRPFSQVDASTTRRYGGTGLGLSIVRRLVEMMGGYVAFDSQEGEGSRFWFTAVFQPRAGGEQTAPPLLAGRRVLLAAANASCLDHLGELLSQWQCASAAVRDLDAALECLGAASGGGFDALLVDWHLPGGGGEQLCLRLAADPNLARLPVVLMTPLRESTEWEQRNRPETVVTITKPLREGELGAALAYALGLGARPKRAGTKPAAAHAQAEVRARRRLLLVEDNPTNQEVAVGILELLGYSQVTVVEDGRQALDALTQSDFDLVLMDCQLPEMDGYEASRLIRRPETPVRNHQIPIVAITAHTMASDRDKCLAAGMNDYVTKPIQFGILDDVLERCLSATAGAPANQLPRPQASEEPNTSVFDSPELVRRLAGNVGLARRVVNRFLLDVPQQLVALSQALERADAESARMTAHSIKGAAANTGGTLLRDAARRLEELGKSGDLDGARGLLPELEAEVHRFRAGTDSFLGGPAKQAREAR